LENIKIVKKIDENEYLEEEILFNIKRKHLNTGLRGFPVGTVRTSYVDEMEGVFYVGYPIRELVEEEPEEVIFLLLYKRLPTRKELKEFKREIRERAKKFPTKVLKYLSALPQKAHPMEWLITGILYIGMHSKQNNYEEDGLNLIAWSNELVANIFRLRENWGKPIPYSDELDYIENFVNMLGVPSSNINILKKVLKNHYILHFDHGGGNLSTFTGKVIASSLANIYTAISGAMGGLSGERHGGANQKALILIMRVGNPNKAHIRNFIEDVLNRGELIYGFGHEILRKEDTRATIEYELAKELFPENKLVKIALAMREIVPQVLAISGKVRSPYPIIDAVSGLLLHSAGLQKPEYYTVLFGWARIVGIIAQIIDERYNLRKGKGTPLYSCKYIYEHIQDDDY
jgi:citrate synthase